MLILASSSPRRKELIKRFGLQFATLNPRYEEEKIDGNILSCVSNIAKAKVRSISDTVSDRPIIGADTIVVLEDKPMGKPKTSQEAKKMLTMLSGKWHEVYTGVYILYNDKESDSFIECTKVKFRNIPKEVIDRYVSTGSPFDKAGGYGIQDTGSIFIERIEGDFYNVMGLPMGRIWECLRNRGYCETKVFENRMLRYDRFKKS